MPCSVPPSQHMHKNVTEWEWSLTGENQAFVVSVVTSAHSTVYLETGGRKTWSGSSSDYGISLESTLRGHENLFTMIFISTFFPLRLNYLHIDVFYGIRTP